MHAECSRKFPFLAHICFTCFKCPWGVSGDYVSIVKQKKVSYCVGDNIVLIGSPEEENVRDWPELCHGRGLDPALRDQQPPPPNSGVSGAFPVPNQR